MPFCLATGHAIVPADPRPMFDIAMERGESIAVFPEGTSHTSPQLLPFKDGVSWLALEYLRYLNGQADGVVKEKGRKAVIVPVGLSYLDKSKYRSKIVVT
jgi:glycerol-3-phosphate O-acyltransferase/dihydroxyacetone phosphate acyltransferase